MPIAPASPKRRTVNSTRQLLGLAVACLFGLSGQSMRADVFIPSSAQVGSAGALSGLGAYYYDRNDPPNVINSLAVADSVIANDPVAATFTATLLDYPNGTLDTLSDPTLGSLLGMDAASLSPASAAAVGAGPMVIHFTGIINIVSNFDIVGENSTIDVRFGLGSDDGSRVRIGGMDIVSQDGVGVLFPGVTGMANFESPGFYPVDIIWYDHFGNLGLEWSSSIFGGPGSSSLSGATSIVPTAVLTHNVPEPSTVCLALVGLGALAAFRCSSTMRRSKTTT